MHGAGVPWNTKLGQKLRHRPVTLPAVVGDTATGGGNSGDHAGEAQPNLEVIPEGDEEAAEKATEEQQSGMESDVPQEAGTSSGSKARSSTAVESEESANETPKKRTKKEERAEASAPQVAPELDEEMPKAAMKRQSSVDYSEIDYQQSRQRFEAEINKDDTVGGIERQEVTVDEYELFLGDGQEMFEGQP